MNQFIKVNPVTYESVRNQMDSESGFPNNHATTWFSPVDDCLKAPDGDCVLGCLPEIATNLLANGATELTEEQYQSYLPQMDMGNI